MPNCDLTLRLDDVGPFESAATVHGSLVVRADGDVHVDGSKVALAFETRGPGTKYRGEEIVSSGEAFDLKDAEELSIPFALQLPREPITMSGAIVGIVWTLRATLDVPWAIDPKTDLEIEVIAPPSEAASESASPAETVDLRTMVPGPRTAWSRAAPYVLVLLVVAFFVIRLDGDQMARKSGFGGYQLLFLAIGGSYLIWRFAGRHLLNRYAQRGMGEPEVRVSSDHFRRGGSIDVTVTLTPPADVDIDDIRADLVCTETAYSGGGRDRRSHEHRTVADTTTLSGATSIARAASRTFTSRVSAPVEACPSLDVQNNHIRWEIEVVVSPKSGVDHLTRTPVVVGS